MGESASDFDDGLHTVCVAALDWCLLWMEYAGRRPRAAGPPAVPEPEGADSARRARCDYMPQRASRNIPVRYTYTPLY